MSNNISHSYSFVVVVVVGIAYFSLKSNTHTLMHTHALVEFCNKQNWIIFFLLLILFFRFLLNFYTYFVEIWFIDWKYFHISMEFVQEKYLFFALSSIDLYRFYFLLECKKIKTHLLSHISCIFHTLSH